MSPKCYLRVKTQSEGGKKIISELLNIKLHDVIVSQFDHLARAEVILGYCIWAHIYYDGEFWPSEFVTQIFMLLRDTL